MRQTNRTNHLVPRNDPRSPLQFRDAEPGETEGMEVDDVWLSVGIEGEFTDLLSLVSAVKTLSSAAGSPSAFSVKIKLDMRIVEMSEDGAKRVRELAALDEGGGNVVITEPHADTIYYRLGAEQEKAA